MVPVRPRTALLLVLATAACDRTPPEGEEAWRGTPGHFLQASYPAEYRTGEHVLPAAVLALGDSLYQGRRGRANCVVCHGPFLNAGSAGTNLRNGRWYHGDGSLEHILRATTYGVEASVASPVPYMPPFGGIPLSPEEVQAISAYIHWYAATHPESGTPPEVDPGEG